jgi:hypothetical protein
MGATPMSIIKELVRYNTRGYTFRSMLQTDGYPLAALYDEGTLRAVAGYR